MPASLSTTLHEPSSSHQQPLAFALPAFGDHWNTRWPVIVWSLVALGVAVRLVRFALRFPLWGDECMLAVNYLDRGYLELAQPLDYGQMAPLGYLWAQKLAVDLLGFNEFSLRLVALLGGLASLPLMAHVAGRVLHGLPHAMAVGIFAVAYYPLRHAAELKPYGTDAFWALLLLACAVEWWRRPDRSRWLWALAAAAPLAVFCSLPVVFVAGGISIGLVCAVWRQRSARIWLPFAAYHATLCGAFLGVLWLALTVQASNTKAMAGFWPQGFPPTQFAAALVWLADVLTGEMFAFPLGADRGGSALTSICFAVALVVLWRQGRGAIAGMALGTLVVALLAAALHQYPAGSERLSQYFAPLACLLAGLGCAAIFSCIRFVNWQRRASLGYLALLVAIGVGVMAKDLVQPYKSPYGEMHQGFARWFWNQGVETPELLCVQTDLHEPLSPHCPEYLCAQAIYSPRHALDAREAVADPLQQVRPITAVGFWRDFDSEGLQRLQAWAERMQTAYRLAHVDRHDVMLGDELNQPWAVHYEVYHFEPRDRETSEVAGRPVGRPLLK